MLNQVKHIKLPIRPVNLRVANRFTRWLSHYAGVLLAFVGSLSSAKQA